MKTNYETIVIFSSFFFASFIPQSRGNLEWNNWETAVHVSSYHIAHLNLYFISRDSEVSLNSFF